jgi:methyltransferase (TIGR00027 family)
VTTRAEGDRWDLASSVGSTATMVAAARAVASRDPDPLIDDPYAAPLVRAVGIDFFTKVVDGALTFGDADESGVARLMTDVMAVRTRFFDDFFLDAAAAGVRQAVILASGLDSRAYRLNWPEGTVVYEIDQPRVIEAKTAAMTEIGASPSCDRRAVAVDLRDDWPETLRQSGFDPAAPTAWSAEGLLVYLPPGAQDRLFDDITALSAPGSQLATEYHPDGGATVAARASAMAGVWRDHGFDLDMGELFYGGERTPVVDYLTGHRWQVSARTRPEVFAHYGRTYSITGELAPMGASLAVVAIKK